MSLTLQILVIIVMCGGGFGLSVWAMFYTKEAKKFWEMTEITITDLDKEMKRHKARIEELVEELDENPSAELLKQIAIEEHHVKATRQRMNNEWIRDFHDDIRNVT